MATFQTRLTCLCIPFIILSCDSSSSDSSEFDACECKVILSEYQALLTEGQKPKDIKKDLGKDNIEYCQQMMENPQAFRSKLAECE